MGWEIGFTHTHLRIEDSCYFCNTSVLKSTHIDCTIYSSLYPKIQQGVEFCARLRDGLVSLKDEHGEERHTVHSILQPYTQHNLHSMLLFVGFHIWGNKIYIHAGILLNFSSYSVLCLGWRSNITKLLFFWENNDSAVESKNTSEMILIGITLGIKCALHFSLSSAKFVILSCQAERN